jgi:hypothetical protein
VDNGGWQAVAWLRLASRRSSSRQDRGHAIVIQSDRDRMLQGRSAHLANTLVVERNLMGPDQGRSGASTRA